MIKGIGIDMVELSRIEKIITRKSSFVNRVLTENEQALFEELPHKRQVEFLAGRFACKEAFSKAWGTGIGAVGLQDIEILKEKNGAPKVTKSPHDGQVFVSISHTETSAVAQIILESS
ncbi:holo-ACP synthase [Enterococcus sp. DIV0242_7C1]|uniref:Holo-[acyl-carrier-protein] synthase n=1 Tax=Candidatus Enterococcus dunnyi TaxID=1834192 RepID=A0A200J789_9ENTE|nr:MULTISPECIES: holo-ACP synthase [unclassified Enterococcus]MBO0470595.1 holo-ACP synthase [Enterococcus sp. DIV0242_7C1]MCA5012267.1 holo-ACP synthase [Enterococcus sp. S23]MCA5015518.1 holo-ACP synthase [Enterococcus sp. S22(2020)]OUZ33038.1 holo-[acyl-carrier-protein] synthase [Enterococcus sp. 9D6_DIV0238]